MSDKPSILLAGNFLSHRGDCRSILEDLELLLRKRGYEVTCLSPYRNRYVRSAHFILGALWRRRRYDVALLDLYSGPAFWWGEALSIVFRLLKKPFIVTLRGGSLPEYAAEHPRRVGACLQRAAVVTAPSGYLVETMGSLCDRIVELANPLYLSRYEFRPREQPQPRLVWLRRFHEIYNPAMAAEVLALLVEEFPEASLVMVGDERDGSMERTRQVAAELQVLDRIEFTGGVAKTEVPNALQAGDIFLNTTDFDNSPVSLLEAMACGLPVISTNVGGMPHFVVDGEEAILTPQGDAAAMAAAVRRVLLEPGLAKKLAHSGRLLAEQSDWKHVLPRWLNLIEEIAGNRPAAEPVSLHTPLSVPPAENR